jgi:thioredoxin reductase (NADPH)
MDAVVIGGGNSAGQAAMFLSRAVRCVRLLVRGASLAASMSRYLASRLEADPKISIEFDAEVTALHGTQHLCHRQILCEIFSDPLRRYR